MSSTPPHTTPVQVKQDKGTQKVKMPFKSLNEPKSTDAEPLPDWSAMGEALRIWPDEVIPPPPVCLSVHFGDQVSTFGTLGNFSVLIGKAKSRKTFTISVALAAALKRGLILNRFAGTFDEDKHNVLYFDTEQGRYHVLKVVKRICELSNQPTPPNLWAYSLRALSTEQRLGFIQWHIYNTPNVGLVVIDGIRDTVKDINDNEEATDRTNDLLRWTEERNIHILTVIHMNKGNDQIRGTIGTELQNKAETVVSVAVDPTDKDVSIVTAELCRDKSFEPFAFSIDEQGLPFIIDDWQPDTKTAGRIRNESNNTKPGKISITSRFTADEHKSIVRRMFADVEPGKYAITWQRLKQATEYFGNTIGDNPAKELLGYYQDLKYITQDDKKRYALAISDEEQASQPDPFFADFLSDELSIKSGLVKSV